MGVATHFAPISFRASDLYYLTAQTAESYENCGIATIGTERQRAEREFGITFAQRAEFLY